MLLFVVSAIVVLASQSGSPVPYRVDPASSRLVIEVGRAGLLKAFGHDHRIVAEGLTGLAEWSPEAPESSRFVLEIQAASLSVADEELSEADRAQVQADMESKALALPDHPSIRFESDRVILRGGGGDAFEVEVEGTLDLRGVRKRLRVPMKVELDDGALTASGELRIDSDAWGVPQISAVGGTVKTNEELGVVFEIRALR